MDSDIVLIGWVEKQPHEEEENKRQKGNKIFLHRIKSGKKECFDYCRKKQKKSKIGEIGKVSKFSENGKDSLKSYL
jgi:DUF1009 family protein